MTCPNGIDIPQVLQSKTGFNRLVSDLFVSRHLDHCPHHIVERKPRHELYADTCKDSRSETNLKETNTWKKEQAHPIAMTSNLIAMASNLLFLNEKTKAEKHPPRSGSSEDLCVCLLAR